jgi:hypothetical protein
MNMMGWVVAASLWGLGTWFVYRVMATDRQPGDPNLDAFDIGVAVVWPLIATACFFWWVHGEIVGTNRPWEK